MFITFEGGEGVGKTSQMMEAGGVLQAQGYEVHATREPGWGPFGKTVREILLNPAEGAEPAPLAEALLLLADRANHVEKMIRPALARENSIVLCDRYMDSTFAYQGYGRGIDVLYLKALNAIATGDLVPDLTVFIDLDPEVGLSRSRDVNRMEREGLEFHRRVYRGFVEELTGRRDRRVAFVTGTNTPEIVHAEIMGAILRLLKGG